MLVSSEGIVLRTTKYQDNKLILSVYTRERGLVSLLAFRSKRRNEGLYSPMTLITFTFSGKTAHSLYKLKEATRHVPLMGIYSSVSKQAICMFLNELTLKVIKEEEPNKDLFDFLSTSIQFLDGSENDYANFHLLFMLKLTRFLGFYPRERPFKQNTYFDIQNGSFVDSYPNHPLVGEKDEARGLHSLMGFNYDTLENTLVDGKLRNKVLKLLLSYYQFHVSNFGEMKSHDVLHEVLHL